MKKIGKRTYRLGSPCYVNGWCAVVGKKEKEGPFAPYFEHWSEDEYFGEKTFEQAEIRMQKEAISHVIGESKLSEKDIDMLFAGDLQNQCAGANYGARNLTFPYFGVYGACSTMAETLILSSMAVDGGFAQNTLAVTSSHFCSAERQYRFPLAYGAQRPPSSQWTVTGAGCVMLGGSGEKDVPRMDAFTAGEVVDYGVTDMNNMGAAMAPAAAATLEAFWEDTATVPDDYDLIVTGDLGRVGSWSLLDLLQEHGVTLGKNYMDCGMMIFDEHQDVHSGGSGCGCSASMLCAYLLPMLKKNVYRKLLFVATGALMNPTLALQGESIPGIAHLVSLTAGGEVL